MKLRHIIDIHSHLDSKQREDTIYNIIYPTETSKNIGNYSLGIHPWYIPQNINWSDFHLEAQKETILAIGEAGIDNIYSNAPNVQIEVFKQQAIIAHELQKPLIIHLVKSQAEIIKIHQLLKPSNPWIIHGFRGKPEQAKQFLQHQILLSFGEKYNPKTLTQYFCGLIETDDATISIENVLDKVAIDLDLEKEQLYQLIKERTNTIFF